MNRKVAWGRSSFGKGRLKREVEMVYQMMQNGSFPRVWVTKNLQTTSVCSFWRGRRNKGQVWGEVEYHPEREGAVRRLRI